MQVVDAWDAGGGRDTLRLRLPTAGLQAGAAWLEAQRGSLLGPARPLLLLPARQAALAVEVSALVRAPSRQMGVGGSGMGSGASEVGAASIGVAGRTRRGSAAGAGSGDVGGGEADAGGGAARACDAFLAELGIVLGGGQWAGPQQTSPGTADHAEKDSCEREVLEARIARRLLAFACDAGAPNLAEAVLPAAAAGLLPAAAVAAVEDEIMQMHFSVTSGLSGAGLLARAVRSGSAAMVDALLRWGEDAGHVWRADTPGVAGLTPLHLAALAGDGGATALRLIKQAVPPDNPTAGAAAWFAAAADDGLTPADFAAQLGRGSLNVAVAGLIGIGAGFGTPGGSGCGCGMACPVCSGPRGCRCGTQGFMCGFGGCGGGAGGGCPPTGGVPGGHDSPRSSGGGGSGSAGCCGGGMQAPACCP